MEKLREILHLCLEQKLSLRKASKAIGVSKTTVGEYLAEFKRSGLSYFEMSQMSDSMLAAIFEGANQFHNKEYEILSKDFLHYEKELCRPGVTLLLLWEEYKTQYHGGFSYSRFCHHYRMWLSKQHPSMHMVYKAGEKMFVDFTGKKLLIIDRNTGVLTEVEVFVAILATSQLTYAEASMGQGKEDWIRLNENALHFFGGSPMVITPDNLKSGVTKACKYEPIINETYKDFARHYNTVIVPARPAHPKDKPFVENAVNLIYQRVFAPLRNQTFFNLEELNDAIWEKLDKHNCTSFQKRETTRRDLFEEIERQELKLLPADRYILKEYQASKVQYNYHIYLKGDKHYYSVPWQFTGKKVQVIYTCSSVDIYHNNERIAFHTRNRRNYTYSTKKGHMPREHQFINGWDTSRFLRWANKKGVHVHEFIQKLLDSKEHPEQAFKSCMGVLKLGDKYEGTVINIVCKKAVEFNCISYGFIKNSLKNKTYLLTEEIEKLEKLPEHKNIRGKANYK
ncbi:IS21 family transposase [bacterium]|nr:IS21 family transposase [bacterium]